MTKELFPKWIKADLAVYASPLYYYHLNATMKAFIERTLPILQPFFEERENRTIHPLRDKHPKLVFLSVAGFPEDEIFDQLSSWANFIYGRTDMLVAEIYRPAAGTLVNPYFKDKADDILAATAQAGGEIVKSMQMQPDTMRRIKQVIVEDKDMYHKMGNVMWKTCIAEGVTPKEFEEKGIIPRPDSIDTFLRILTMGFKAKEAEDTTGTIQFNFDGEVQGSCHIVIQDGKLEAKKGTAKDASMTINSPFELWMDIMTGKADGQQMFMEKKYTVDGDFNLLLRMNQLFGNE